MAKSKSKSPASMEELLAASGQKIKSFTKGEKIKAKFVQKTERTAIFDIGGKSEGMVVDTNFAEARNLIERLKAGDEVLAVVVEPESRDGVTLLSLKGAAADDFWKKLRKLHESGEHIEVIVKSVNPHGLVVAFENETAFIPVSQLGSALVRLGEDVINKHIKTKIIDLDESNLRIVLSEKAVSEAHEIEKLEEALGNIKEGDIFTGKVTTVTNFGAFVEIEIPVKDKKAKVEGLVHVSEFSYTKVARPEDEVSVGDKVNVKVIGVERGKLSLSIKQTLADPWSEVEEKYHPDDKVTGTVVRISDFGAFVELSPGIEGLVHITKIPPGTALKVGQKVTCYVEEIDKKIQRLSLGLVVTSAKPIGYK